MTDMTEATREYVWTDIREETIDAWGTAPQGALESDIIDIFQRHPELVIDTITRIGISYQTGTVRNPWAVLRADLQKQGTPERNPTVKSTRNRDKAIARAEQWIKNAGIHYDRYSEVELDLFGDRGTLQPFKSEKLIERFRKSWEQARPTGEQLEHDEIERGQRWIKQRATMPKPHPAASGMPQQRAAVHGEPTPAPEYCDPADYDYGNPNT